MQISHISTSAIASALILLYAAVAQANLEYACDPRSSEVTCLLGCLGCYEAYGGHMYNMAACCQECKDTQKSIVDDGPAKCSEKFIKMSWMRKFGK
ncbi:hypothetical protein DPMN_087422 [Dreissena polymorpha]|uniref:Eclosion hormone n=1 Tax=Dreissena polymorpha TaxID=45954 RepID=A0A9D4KT59_DREPO|nr:hypothetical protein DPMN_087422 [Dreissena polymorpha]